MKPRLTIRDRVVYGRQSGANLIPDFLKNAVFYFDKNLSTVTDSGTLQVNDITLCASNLKQSTAGYKPNFDPTNGLTFDNTDDTLLFDTPIYLSSKSFTIYFRYNRSSAADDTIFLGDITDSYGDYMWMLFRASSVFIQRGAGSTASFTSLAAGDITGDHLYKFTADGTNVKFFVDGTEKGSVSWPATWETRTYLNIKSLGSYNASYQRTAGSFSQIIIFNKKIDSTQEALVEAQLSAENSVSYSLQTKNCILFTGQSNCDGRQVITNYASQYQTQTKTKILGLNSATFKNIADPIDQGEGINGTIEYYRSFEAGYGYLAPEIYLLKFGIGSTFLANKVSTQNWFFAGTSTTYSLILQLKRHWLFFNQLMKSLGYNSNWLNYWWMQGEQDATVEADANAYETNLTDFINGWRSFIGFNIPFTIMRIYGPPDSSQAYYLTIQSAVANVKANLTGINIISTDSYTKSDVAHYNVSGYLQGGTDLYNQNYL